MFQITRTNWEQEIHHPMVFQNMVVDLFNEEGYNCFVNRSPFYVGSDGGIDGQGRGDYKGRKGLHSVQAKWTSKTMTEAFKDIPSSLKDEIEKANENGSDYLHFFHSANLHAKNHVQELYNRIESGIIDKGNLKEIIIHPREDIIRLLEDNLFVRHKYLNIAQQLSIVDLETYENEMQDKQICFKHDCVGNENILVSAVTAIEGDTSGIILLAGDKGAGKSRFLYELANKIDTDHGRRALFLRMPTGFNNDINNLNLQKYKYILAWDNADIFINSVGWDQVIERAVGNSPPMIVMTVTSDKLTEVKKALIEKNITPKDTLFLESLNDSELVSIYTGITGGKIDDERGLLNTCSRNPLRLSIRAHAEKDSLAEKERRKELLQQIDYDRITQLNISKEEYYTLLFHISLVCPIGDRQEFYTILDDKVSIENIDEVIESLIGIGILREVGNHIRFNSDETGNIFLANSLVLRTRADVIDSVRFWIHKCSDIGWNLWRAYCYSLDDREKIVHILRGIFNDLTDSDKESFLKTFIKFIAPIIPEEVLSYLETRVTSKTDSGIDIHAPIITNVKESFLKTFIKFIAPIIPEEVLSYLETRVTSKTDFDMDTYAPIITNIIDGAGPSDKIIDLLYNINNNTINTPYSNYKPESLIQKCVSLFNGHPMRDSITSLQHILKKVQAGNTQGLLLTEEALILSLSLEQQRTYTQNISMVHRRYGIQMTYGVIEYRDVALNILLNLLQSGNTDLVLSGLKVVKNSLKTSDSMDDEIRARLHYELSQVIPEIRSMLSKATEHQMIGEIEDTLIHIWACNSFTDAEALEYSIVEILTSSIDRSPEYIVFKIYQSSSRTVILDFAEVLDNIDETEGRWSWLVHNTMDSYQEEKERVLQVVTFLNNKITTPADLIALISRGIDHRSGGFPYIPLIERWNEINPDLISNTWEQCNKDIVSPAFRRGFENVQSNKDPMYVTNQIEEMLSKDTLSDEDIERFIYLVFFIEIQSSLLSDYLTSVLSKDISDIQLQGVGRVLYHLYEKSSGYEGVGIIAVSFLGEYMKRNLSIEIYLDLFLNHLLKEEKISGTELETLSRLLIEYFSSKGELDYTEQCIAEKIFKDHELYYGYLESKLKTCGGGSGFMAYDIVDSESAVIAKLYTDIDRIFLLVATLLAWKNDGWIDTRSLVKLLKKIPDCYSHIMEIFNTKLKEEDKRHYLFLLGLVKFSAETVEFYVRLLEESIDNKYYDIARDNFLNRLHTGTWVSTAGEETPMYRDAITNLQQARSISTKATLQKLFSDLEGDFENRIVQDKKDDEDFMNPKM